MLPAITVAVKSSYIPKLSKDASKKGGGIIIAGIPGFYGMASPGTGGIIEGALGETTTGVGGDACNGSVKVEGNA